MTNSKTAAMQENLKTIQTEGGQRARKIAAIFKGAFTEAFTEVKEGGSTVRPFAKELADTTVQVVKEKGQAAYASAKEAAQTTATDEKDVVTRLKRKLQAIAAAIKTAVLGSAGATKPEPTKPVGLVEPAVELPTVTVVDSQNA